MERREAASKSNGAAAVDLKRVIESTAVVKPKAPADDDKDRERERDGKPGARRVNRLSETSDGGSEGSCEVS